MAPIQCPPVRPTLSATAVPVRQGRTTIQVYLLRRNPASSAFPGFYVFPGGTLEPDDMDTAFWINHVDLVNHQPPTALNGEMKKILPFAVAAIRETFEEAGLLLASSATGIVRPELLSRNGRSFCRQIAHHDLQLSISKLKCWSHWISPASMPKRFDTFFFVTPVDPGQECRPDNNETVHGLWIDPASALIKNSEGRCPLSPPTLVTLHQLLDYKDLGDLMAEAHSRVWPEPLMPRMWPLDKGALIIEPWDAEYAVQTVTVYGERLEGDLLPPHAPFSRLWLHQGSWRPVACPDPHGRESCKDIAMEPEIRI